MSKVLQSKIFLILVFIIFCFSASGCLPSLFPQSLDLATISGTVFGNLDNTVVLGANVTTTGNGKTYETKTDQNGKYSLQLPEGNYHLTVTMETFNDLSADVVATSGETKTQDFKFVIAGGLTLDFPQYFNWGIEAITGPQEMDSRSLQFNPDSQKVPYFRFDNVKDIANGYECYVSVWNNIVTEENIGIKGVRVYKSETIGGPFILITSVPYRIYPDRCYFNFYDFNTNLNPGDTSKFYSISCYSDSGETDRTSFAQTVPLPECTLLNPASKATNVSLTPTFSWNPVNSPGCTYYITIYKWDTAWNEWSYVAKTYSYGTSKTYDSSWWDYKAFEPGTLYTWGVEAAKGITSYSDSHSFSYGRTFTTANL